MIIDVLPRHYGLHLWWFEFKIWLRRRVHSSSRFLDCLSVRAPCSELIFRQALISKLHLQKHAFRFPKQRATGLTVSDEGWPRMCHSAMKSVRLSGIHKPRSFLHQPQQLVYLEDNSSVTISTFFTSHIIVDRLNHKFRVKLTASILWMSSQAET